MTKLTIEDENGIVTIDNITDDIMMRDVVQLFYNAMLARGCAKESLDKFINLEGKQDGPKVMHVGGV